MKKRGKNHGQERVWITVGSDSTAALQYMLKAAKATKLSDLDSEMRDYKILKRGFISRRGSNRVSCISFRVLLLNGTGFRADCELYFVNEGWNRAFIRIVVFGGRQNGAIRGLELARDFEHHVRIRPLERRELERIRPKMAEVHREHRHNGNGQDAHRVPVSADF